MSVHPHLDADAVARVIGDWLGDSIDEDERLAMTEPCVTELGLLDWTLTA